MWRGTWRTRNKFVAHHQVRHVHLTEIYIHVYMNIHAYIYEMYIYSYICVNVYACTWYQAKHIIFASTTCALMGWLRLVGSSNYTSLLQNIISFIGRFAKETYTFKEPTSRSHPIPVFWHRVSAADERAYYTMSTRLDSMWCGGTCYMPHVMWNMLHIEYLAF